MERRVLLAIFLAFLVLYVWQAAFVKPVPKPAPGTTAATTEAAPASGANSEGSSAPPSRASSTPAAASTTPAAPAAPAAAPLVADTAERDVRVETRDVIAVFTNRGARLKSWRLKHYLDQQRQPQELIEQHLATHPLPFALRTANDAVTATVNDALYTVAGAPAATDAESSPVDLRFEYRDSAGVHVVKAFHLDP
jgi:YidC/Oxa1 family membrane protein insertase